MGRSILKFHFRPTLPLLLVSFQIEFTILFLAVVMHVTVGHGGHVFRDGFW